MKYIPLKEQVINERKKNTALQDKVRKNNADIDYIAMMCDVELENDLAEEE